MTNCAAIIAQFADWQDGELTLAAAAVVETHLRQCGACQSQWQQWQQEDAHYRQALGTVVVPQDLNEKIRQRLAAAERRRAMGASAVDDFAIDNAVNAANLVTPPSGLGDWSPSLLRVSSAAENAPANPLTNNNIITDQRLTKEGVTSAALNGEAVRGNGERADNGAEWEGRAIWRLVAGLAGLGLLGGQLLLVISHYAGANFGLSGIASLTTWVPSAQAMLVTAQSTSGWAGLSGWSAMSQIALSSLPSWSIDAGVGGVLALLILQLIGSKWLISEGKLVSKAN